MTDERFELLRTWICQFYAIAPGSLQPVSGDASFRRYFRFIAKHAFNGKDRTLIAVDAPPHLENSQPFIKIASLLAKNSIPVPHIYHFSLEKGFYIQQDFGDQLLLDRLNQSTAGYFYRRAMHHIIDLQEINTDSLPLYDSNLLQSEMQLFTDWYLAKHRQLTLTTQQVGKMQTCFQSLLTNALEQPQVFVHRDYHSRNLMVLENDHLGIIDFQDAVKGAITYDLVSLLRDCYIDWPKESIDAWLKYFHHHQCRHYRFEQFVRWFDLMGMQRHLKAVGIFCRLHYRDGKSGYLNDIPRTLSYIISASKKYPEFNMLSQIIGNPS